MLETTFLAMRRSAISFFVGVMLVWGSAACSSGGGANDAAAPGTDIPAVDAGADSGASDSTVVMDETVAPPRDAPLPPADDGGTTATPDTGTTPPSDAGGCQSPLTACGGDCVSLLVSAAHCGRCGNACTATEVCRGGVCASTTTCVAPEALCAGACTDVTHDAANCGECGRRCAAGQVCMRGLCAAGPSGAIEPGRSCARNADCPGTGATCAHVSAGWPGGYCQYRCAATTDCGAMGVCARPGLGSTSPTVCLQRCASDGQCRTGYFCRPAADGSYCYPLCDMAPDTLCGTARCDATTHTCQPCTAASQCAAGSTCASGRCACTAATACGGNRRCYTASGACGCANDLACGPDDTCDTATGACVPRG